MRRREENEGISSIRMNGRIHELVKRLNKAEAELRVMSNALCSMNEEDKMDGVGLIAEERTRQIIKKGYTAEHDDEHDAGELILAAISYAAEDETLKLRHNRIVLEDKREGCVIYSDPWPWGAERDKRKKYRRRRIHQLAIAGALIAAEIDRLQRALEV